MRLFELDNKIDMPKMLKQIKTRCQPFLQQVKDPFTLYRGLEPGLYTGELPPMFLKKQARLTDRIPTAMGRDDHNAINHYFKQEFKRPFRNGVFVTGDIAESQGYGDGYVVFPIGKFEFLWSPKIDDINYQKQDLIWNDRNMDSDESELIRGLKEAKYTTENLQAAIKSKHEIMIWCKEYFAISLIELNSHKKPALRKLLK